MYEKIREHVERGNYIVEPLRYIDYGVQFDVYGINGKELVRIFESKKKGISVDLSQVRDDMLKSIINSIRFDDEPKPCLSELGVEDKVLKLYKKFELRASEEGLGIIDVKRIDYGIQIKLLFPSGCQEVVRIYNSNKKGLSLDLSLIKDYRNYDELSKIYSLSHKDYLISTTIKLPSPAYIPKQTLPKKKSKKRKKNKKSEQSKSDHRKEIQESKAQKPLLDKVANNIIEYTKNNGISVMRYDSKISESIYLKFDYGMAGSLRISAHNSKKTELKYTFNIIKGLEKPYVETARSSNGQECKMYFYPFELSENVALDIVRYRNYRLSKYGDLNYDNYMQKHKSSVGVRSGFWSKAVEV